MRGGGGGGGGGFGGTRGWGLCVSGGGGGCYLRLFPGTSDDRNISKC